MTFKPNSYVSLFTGVFIIGFAAILIRKAEAPGTVTAFYRLAIGTGVITLPFLIYLRKQRRTLPARGIWLAIAGGFFFAMDMAFWSTGVVMSGAAIPTLMVNTAPLWVGLGALILFREQQSARFWAGLLLASIGSLIIMKEDIGDATAVEWGGLLGSIAAVFYAGFHLISQKGRALLNTLGYFWISSLSATVVLFIINIILGNVFTGYPAATYVNFILLGIGVQVGGWLLVNYAQGYLLASIVAPSLLAQPVFTAVLAWIILAEYLSAWQISGGIVVLAGIYVVHWSRRK